MQLEGSLTCSQDPTIGPLLSQFQAIHTITPASLRTIAILIYHRKICLTGSLFPWVFQN